MFEKRAVPIWMCLARKFLYIRKSIYLSAGEEVPSMAQQILVSAVAEQKSYKWVLPAKATNRIDITMTERPLSE